MPRKGRLTKSINKKGCSWLPPGKYLEKGRVVYEFDGCKCIDPGMIAVTNHPGKPPFFEIPRDVVKWDVAPAAQTVSVIETVPAT